jgi:hypothetical protein
MLLHVTYYVGYGEDRDGVPNSTSLRRMLVRNLRWYAIENMGGGTFVEGEGFWTCPKSQLPITEPVVMIVTDTTDGIPEVNKHAAALARIAYQNCVHVTMHETFAADITGEGKVL